MTQDEAFTVLERALSHVSADTATARLDSAREGATRFANNAITQNVASQQRTLRVTAAYGQKKGTAVTNQLDDDAIRDAVRRAEEAARAADPDLEYLPPLGPQTYAPVDGHSPATAAATPADRAAIVARVVTGPAQEGDRAAGSITTGEQFAALATTAGARAYHHGATCRLVATVLSEGASGWAGAGGHDLGRLPVDAVADRAWSKARAARAPEEVPAQPTTVVLEPQAVADMLPYLVSDLDAKAVDEGRSPFCGKEGQRLVSPDVTIRSQPGHPDAPGTPFLDDGAPAEDVAWIQDGVLRNLKTSRYWAQKTGRPRVGFPGNIVMDGGAASTEDLIAQVEDGLLVTRFWYIRYVDPMQLLLTGMTRDGLYRIRNGKVAGAAVNMRFNESPLRMLDSVAALGRPERTRDAIVAPPLLIHGFRFTSVTRF